MPGALRRLTCVGPAVPTPDWQGWLTGAASVPDQCAALPYAAAAPVYGDAAPSVQLFDPAYTAPRSWRGNLAYSSGWKKLVYTVEGTYSLNLDQPGTVDLNFSGTPRFTLPDEGRPVFVNAGSIVPTTGAASTIDARRAITFGRVVSSRSDLRSVSRQVTFTLSPDLNEGLPGVFFSMGYTLGQVRALARGFDGATFGSPAGREWARGDLDARHAIVYQGGMSRKGITLTLFGRFASGTPFTPMIAGDVNGDGLADVVMPPGLGPDSPTTGAVIFGSRDGGSVDPNDLDAHGFRYGVP
jgi:hypothetical protein